MIENLLEQILHKLNEINQRIAVVESQQNIIMNRMAKDAGAAGAHTSQQENDEPTKIPVTQQLIGDDKKGIVAIQVTIYDKEGNVSRQTRTNNAGVWRVFLEPGDYQAHYHKTGLIDRNTHFTVKPTDSIIQLQD